MRKYRKQGENPPLLTDSFAPVKCDIDAEIAENMQNPAYRNAYEENEEEFALIEAMLEAQRPSQLSQAEIAERMGTKQPGVSRLLRRNRHTSFSSALSFIHANGMRIKRIELEPIPPAPEELLEN